MKVYPQEPGEIKLTHVEWSIFNGLKCQFDFATDINKLFHFKVVEKSSELTVDLQMDRSEQTDFILGEATRGRLIMTPSSE